MTSQISEFVWGSGHRAQHNKNLFTVMQVTHPFITARKINDPAPGSEMILTFGEFVTIPNGLGLAYWGFKSEEALAKFHRTHPEH